MIRNYLTATLPKAFIRLICPKDKEDGEESACMHAHIHPYTHTYTCTYIHFLTHRAVSTAHRYSCYTRPYPQHIATRSFKSSPQISVHHS